MCSWAGQVDGCLDPEWTQEAREGNPKGEGDHNTVVSHPRGNHFERLGGKMGKEAEDVPSASGDTTSRNNDVSRHKTSKKKKKSRTSLPPLAPKQHASLGRGLGSKKFELYIELSELLSPIYKLISSPHNTNGTSSHPS